MNRDIKKAIREYMQLTDYRKSKTRGAFYTDDVKQIIELSTTDGRTSTADAVLNALQAGFTIGYRTARSDARRDAHKLQEAQQ